MECSKKLRGGNVRLFRSWFAASFLACSIMAASFDIWGANRIIASWKVETIANSSAESVRLTDRANQTIAVLDRLRMVRLVDIFTHLQKSAGLTAELYVVLPQDARPNALATTKDGRNVVGITPSMISLLGDDFDAYAAILGHELAH